MRLLALVAVLLVLCGAVAVAPAYVYGDAAAVDDTFAQDVIFDAEPMHAMTMPQVWAAFGLTPEEGEGRQIVTGEQTPDGGSTLQIVDPGKDASAALRHLAKTGQFDPSYGPVRTIHPDEVGVSGFRGQLALHPDTRKQAIAEFYVEVAGPLKALDPKACKPFAIESDILSTLGLLPEDALLCDATAEGRGENRPFFLTIYRVDRGPLSGPYTSMTCALLNDAILTRRGAPALGREHVCMSLRVGGLMPVADQMALRHYRIARPAA